jgi:hypothetical protein
MLAARDASWALFPCGRGACMPPMCPCPCPCPCPSPSMSCPSMPIHAHVHVHVSMCRAVAVWPCGMAVLAAGRAEWRLCRRLAARSPIAPVGVGVCARRERQLRAPGRPRRSSRRAVWARGRAGYYVGVGGRVGVWARACGRRRGRWGGRRRSRQDSAARAQPFALHGLCLPGGPSLLEVPPSPLPGLRRLSATIPARSCL